MARSYTVAELKGKANGIIEEVQITQEPAFITVNGHAMTVLVDADTYLTQMQALGEFERIFRDMSSIKPKTPIASAEAPAELEPGTKGRIAWRCSICGYIVEADELPDDYKCPICGQGKEVFERIMLED